MDTTLFMLISSLVLLFFLGVVELIFRKVLGNSSFKKINNVNNIEMKEEDFGIPVIINHRYANEYVDFYDLEKRKICSRQFWWNNIQGYYYFAEINRLIVLDEKGYLYRIDDKDVATRYGERCQILNYPTLKLTTEEESTYQKFPGMAYDNLSQKEYATILKEYGKFSRIHQWGIIVALIIGVLSTIIGFTSLSPESSTDNSYCESCERRYDDSTNGQYLKYTDMCRTCYRNYCYATGKTPKDYD